MAQHIDLYATLRPIRRSLFTRAGSILVIALAAGAVVLLDRLEAQRAVSLRAELQRTTAEAERLQRLLEQVPSPSAGAAERLAREDSEVALLEAVAARLASGGPGHGGGFSATLRALGRTTIDGVWLTAIRLEPASGTMTLEGRALDASGVPAYIERLRRDPLLAGKALTSLDLKAVADRDSGLGGVQFRLVAAPERVSSSPAGAAIARSDIVGSTLR